MEADLTRLQRDVESIYVRLRTVENVDTPRQKELLSELREVRNKVIDMDTKGTAVTQERIGRIQDAINVVDEKLDDLKKDVDARFNKIDEYQASVRTTMRSALVTAALSVTTTIVGGVILWILTRN